MNSDIALAAPHRNDGWTWRGIATVRPMRGGLFKSRVIGLTRVLNVDHDALIGHDRAAGLSAGWDSEEALELASILSLGRHRVQTIIGAERITVG